MLEAFDNKANLMQLKQLISALSLTTHYLYEITDSRLRINYKLVKQFTSSRVFVEFVPDNLQLFFLPGRQRNAEAVGGRVRGHLRDLAVHHQPGEDRVQGVKVHEASSPLSRPRSDKRG